MDTKEFFQSVVSWHGEGYVSIHYKRPEGFFSGRSHISLEAFLEDVAALQANPQTNYWFCLSRQELGGGQRSRKHAQWFRSLYAEIDLKDGIYADKLAAITAIIEFCETIGIPHPSAIIDSGGGIHVYWFSDRDLSLSDWQPYADGLKTALKNNNIKADLQVTADAARILRIPGTLNYKYDPPRKVRIIPSASGAQHDFAQKFSVLLKTKLAGKLGPVHPSFAHIAPSSLTEGMQQGGPPLSFENVKLGCPWLAEVHNTGGAKEREPLWHDAMRVAVFFGEDEGSELAHAFSNQHVRYNYQDTQTKFERALADKIEKDLGYPKCQTIQDNGCKHCEKCEHLEKGGSPLHLGQPQLAEQRARQIYALGGESPPELMLPSGFCLKDGLIHALMPPTKLAPGGWLLKLFNNKVSKPTLQWQDGQYGLGLRVQTEMDMEVDVFIGAGDVYGGSATKLLGRQLVLVDHSRQGGERLVALTTSWLDKLRAVSNAVKDTGTLGWRVEDGKRIGFAYNGAIYRLDGMVIPIPTTGDDEFRKHYVPVGNSKYWYDAAKLLTDRQRPELDCIIATGFAAPLMAFTGNLYGGILSVWGDPGTSKSTAQQIAAAIWGQPKQVRESLNSTPKSVQGRLGRIRNLPVYWDDVQDERHQERLFQTMFVATEGAEGGRLNPDASYKERLEWQTLLVACSNRSFVDYLVQIQKQTTAGIRRVFEFKLEHNDGEPGLIDVHDANNAFGQLTHHYGHVGLEYVKLLTTKYDMVEALVNKTVKRFCTRVHGTADENYWWSMCGMMIAGAQLATQHLEAGIDYERLEEFLIKQFEKNRELRSNEGTEGGTLLNTETTLKNFLNYCKGKDQIVYTVDSYTNRFTKVETRHTPKDGYICAAHAVIGERKIYVSKHVFREYLVERDMNPRQIIDGILKHCDGKEVRFTIGGGTVSSKAQEICLLIPVTPHGPFETLLFAWGDSKIVPRLVPPKTPEDDQAAG